MFPLPAHLNSTTAGQFFPILDTQVGHSSHLPLIIEFPQSYDPSKVHLCVTLEITANNLLSHFSFCRSVIVFFQFTMQHPLRIGPDGVLFLPYGTSFPELMLKFRKYGEQMNNTYLSPNFKNFALYKANGYRKEGWQKSLSGGFEKLKKLEGGSADWWNPPNFVKLDWATDHFETPLGHTLHKTPFHF